MAKVFFNPDEDELIVRRSCTKRELSVSERKLLKHIADGNRTVDSLQHFLTTANGRITIEEARCMLDAALANLVSAGYLYTLGRPLTYQLTQNGWNAVGMKESCRNNPDKVPDSRPSHIRKSSDADYPAGYYAKDRDETTWKKKPALNSKDGVLAESFDEFYGIMNREEMLKGKKKSKSRSNEDGSDSLFE